VAAVALVAMPSPDTFLPALLERRKSSLWGLVELVEQLEQPTR
jgi:hypothetical protein